MTIEEKLALLEETMEMDAGSLKADMMLRNMILCLNFLLLL